MSRILGLASSAAIIGIILFGLAMDYSISFGQDSRLIIAGIVTIGLILVTKRMYLPMNVLESFIPKSRLDTVIVVLVLLQMIYCYWEVNDYSNSSYTGSHLVVLSIAAYLIVLLAIPSYLHGKKWAWALLFLFSIYILHVAIILKHDWQYHYMLDRAPVIPKWAVFVGLAVSLLCLRILRSTAGSHLIDWREFARILGAIAISSSVIWLKAAGIFRNPRIIEDTMGVDLMRPVSTWEIAIRLSGFWAWRHLLLLWCSYGCICIITWFFKKAKGDEPGKIVQV